MKNFINKSYFQKTMAIGLLIVSGFSYANERPAAGTVLGPASEQVCSGFRDAAGAMMALRQYERPLAEAVSIQEEVLAESQRDEIDLMFNDMLHEIILHAYSVDINPDDNGKITTISQFGNAYYTVCMNELV